jgi:ADP-ribosylglycohydrolase
MMTQKQIVLHETAGKVPRTAAACASASSAVLMGAQVSDAMGAPAEAMDAAEIELRHRRLSEFAGSGMDDSLMASLLIEAPVRSGGRASPDEWAAEITAGHELIYAQRQQFFPSVLRPVAKLSCGVLSCAAAHDSLPSSSSALSVWPVGAVNARQAYAHSGLPR